MSASADAGHAWGPRTWLVSINSAIMTELMLVIGVVMMGKGIGGF